MIEIALLKNYDGTEHKAGVQLMGSLTTYLDNIPVSVAIPPSAMVVGNRVILAIPGGNIKDAVVIATWPEGSSLDLHASSHQDGGADEINVAGLSGLLADHQKALRLRTGLDANKPASGNTEGDVWWATDTDKMYVWDGAAWKEMGAGGGGASTFLQLTDTPSSYQGQAGKAPAVNTGEDALVFARFLAAPTGTSQWKNRSYQGWELLTQDTEYTVGSGGEFATLKAAADALKGLILVNNLTIKLVSNVSESQPVVFSGLLSAGGYLIINFNGYTETISLTSGTAVPLSIIGPIGLYLRGGKLSVNSWTKHPPYELLGIYNLVFAQLEATMQFDFNNWSGGRGICGQYTRILTYNIPTANWLNHANTKCIAASYQTMVAFYLINAPSYSALAGGMVIDKDGVIHTT